MFKQFTLIVIFISGAFSYAQLNEAVKQENVIAAYIYNFTKFLEWPTNDSNYFYISIIGESKIIKPLNMIAEKEKINGKEIVIDEINDISNLKPNSMLYLSPGEEYKLQAILRKTSNMNILTISNSDGFARKGVCINFSVVNNKLKFEINRKAIEEAGIVPNTRLLSLAVKIYE